MASIRKRGKGFEVRWLNANGQEDRVMVYTEKAAQIKKKEVELAILQGKQKRADITKMTVADFVYEHWQKTLNVRPGTLASYNNALGKYILPEFGDKLLSEISPMDVEKWQAGMLNGKVFVAKPLAPKSVERIVNVMAAIMKKAVTSKFIDESPFQNFKRKKAHPRKKAMHLEFEQYLTLESTFTERNRILIQVMYHAGLRPSEALGLTWDRIDLEKLEISVDRQLARDFSREVFGPPKTLASYRTVSFGDELRVLLIEHRDKFGEGPHGLLTSNRIGGIYLYRSASDTFNKIARKLALPVGSGLHMLRHTCASNALAAGVNIKMLQTQLGHESITETLDTYGHMMTESRDDYVAKLDAAYRAKLKARKRPHLRAAE